MDHLEVERPAAPAYIPPPAGERRKPTLGFSYAECNPWNLWNRLGPWHEFDWPKLIREYKAT